MFKLSVTALAVAAHIPLAFANQVETLTIYGSRQAQSVDSSLAAVTVLEHADILASQAIDLPALLNQLPGVNLARNGGRGQNSGVFIRGGNTGHTLVLIDGVRTGSATLGQASLAMIPLALIERIEVIRGPRAAWYGADALAGVIAITTRQQQGQSLQLGAGSYGLLETDLGLQQQVGALHVSVNLGLSRADGFNAQPALDPDKDGYWQRFARLGAAYQTSYGDFSWHSKVNRGRYDFDTAFGSADRSAVLQRSHVFSWQQDSGTQAQQLRLSRNLDQDSPFGPAGSNPFLTRRDELDYQLNQQLLPELSGLVGVNWYQEQVEKAPPAYTQSQRINRAVFTGLQYQPENWLFEVAARLDNFSDFGRQHTWQLAAGYYLTTDWLLRVSRGTAFKAPSFNQLFWPGFGNPQLQPETAVANELGLRYQGQQWQSELALFEREVANLIQGVVQAENVLLAKIRGLETQLHWQQQQWSTQLAYTWLDPRNLQTQQPLLQRPKHSLNWRADWQFHNGQLFATADYQSKTFQGFNWNTMRDFPELGGFTVFGFGASFQLHTDWLVQVKLDNLLDKQYQTISDFATAGRTFGVQVRYQSR